MQALQPGRIGALALAVSCAACPGPQRQPLDDAGTAAVVGRSCNVDAECAGLRCDPVRRQCICLSDESCRSGNPDEPPKYCNNYTGLCVTEIAGCTKDDDCKDAQGNVDPTVYCDAAIRSCRPRKGFCEPCNADNECGGAGDNCVLDGTLQQKFCGRACQVAADCPRGASCVDKGGAKQCWPAPNPITGEASTCKSFRGCTPDSLRTCDAAKGDADCADIAGQRCDPAKGKCVAIDQVCPFGTVCDPRNRICVAECAADADCGDPKLRCTNRVCEPIGECTNDNQCPLTKICSIPTGQNAGECLPFCQTDVDCPLGNVCQRGADNRYRCVAGCSSHANCPIDQRCNNSTKQCEGPAVGNARTCQATAVCNTCELCDLTRYECFAAKGTFPYCATCSSDTECPGGACVQMDDGRRYCAKVCAVGQDCPQGFVCLSLSGATPRSACVPADRQCAGKCP